MYCAFFGNRMRHNFGFYEKEFYWMESREKKENFNKIVVLNFFKM